jgi:hypothetical protein
MKIAFVSVENSRPPIVATVELLYRKPRPFILNVFPLMIIPGTELADMAKERGLRLPYIKQGQPSGSYVNALIFALCLMKLPRVAYEFLLRRLAKPGAASQPHPITVRILLSLHVIKRALAHLRFGHLSVLPGRVTWTLWKSGIVGFTNRRILRRCSSVLAEP